MTNTSRNDTPFFVIGNDRSGTTMLRLILDRNSEVSIPTESMFLGDFIANRLPPERGPGLSDRNAAQAFVDRIWGHPKVRLWGISENPPQVPAGLDHAEAYRFAVEAPYWAYATRDGKRRWGDKTPHYLGYVEELLEIWPHAQFVLLVRDGRDVALSIQHLPFGANNVWAAARDWAKGIRTGLAAAQRHPHNVITVCYERLVAEPDREIRRICAFLGLEFTEDMLRLEATPASRLEPDKARWFTGIWAGINESSVGKWRRAMPTKDQAVFLSVAEPELRACGYDCASDVPRSVSPVRTARYRLHDDTVRLANFVRLRLIQERGREVKYVTTRKLRRA